MSNSFFPPADGDFNQWLMNFWTIFGNHWKAWGFSEADWNEFDSAWRKWNDKFAATHPERHAARAEAESAVTGVANQLLGNVDVLPNHWNALGFPWVPSRSEMQATSPMLNLHPENGGVLVSWNVITHPVWNWVEIQWRRENGEWEDLAKVPTSSNNFLHDFEDNAAAQYRARWVSSSDAGGPWSPVATFMAAAA